MGILVETVRNWKKSNGDNTYRINYSLNKDSIVFDIGGYKGWFVDKIHNKYGSKIYCFEPLPQFAQSIKKSYGQHKNIKIFSKGLSNFDGETNIYVNNDASSMHNKNGKLTKVTVTTLDKVLEQEKIDFIDLMKINIEGAEYPFLEDIINKNLQTKIGNFQVQFHMVGENYEERYDSIKKELEKTHELTYIYPFVWENWKLK